MDYHVCLECTVLTRSGGSNSQLAGTFLNAYDFGPEVNVDPKLATALHKLIDQIRVEAQEGTRSAMYDCDLRSGAYRHMSEFKGNISPSNKQNPLREFIQFQELFARRKVVRPRNLQVRWFLSSRDNDMAPRQHFVTYLN